MPPLSLCMLHITSDEPPDLPYHPKRKEMPVGGQPVADPLAVQPDVRNASPLPRSEGRGQAMGLETAYSASTSETCACMLEIASSTLISPMKARAPSMPMISLTWLHFGVGSTTLNPRSPSAAA